MSKLKDLLQLNNVLSQIGNERFELKTCFKITSMEDAIEEKIKSYNKVRNDKLKSLSKDPDDVKDLKESIDYILLPIEGAYNARILVEDFNEFSKEMEKLLDEEVEVEVKKFKLSEFEVDVTEEDDKGKKKKVKKSILNTNMLRVMKDYFTDIDTLDKE